VATVVSVMDRSSWAARTDNIVVVDAEVRLLTWIPRDLWSPMLGNRINTAFQRGGHATLLAALVEQGEAVDEGLCLLRDAIGTALRDVSVRVPVGERLQFWYPLEPDREIEDGKKLVEFNPPSEVLSGERIHQWAGARYDVARADGSDLSRLRRQQVLVRRLIEDGLDFTRAMADPALISMTSETALEELRQVRADWRYATMDDVVPDTIDGKAVLLRPPTNDSTDDAGGRDE
jgi:anionic cell wall polymer biosynthesis LytR-Cps2A-Psr (LCP) family protein